MDVKNVEVRVNDRGVMWWFVSKERPVIVKKKKEINTFSGVLDTKYQYSSSVAKMDEEKKSTRTFIRISQ